MLASRAEILGGWGRFPLEPCTVYRPEREAGVAHLLGSTASSSYIARGLGRSYGDAALNRGGGVVSHLRLNRFLAFDADTGVVECEAGVSLGEIVDLFLPRGWLPPILPGTRHVTVGGAIASDVHGKNHPADGSFAACVEEFRLQPPGGGPLRCSREERPELFRATLGGMGLTGAILSARIRLRRAASAFVRADRHRARDLDAVLALLSADGARYSVAWIDALARGAALGRGVVTRANDEAESRDPIPARRRVAVPFDLPRGALNGAVLRAFNELQYRAGRERVGRRVDVGSFFHPLDAVGDWNRVYGRRGFVQYQAALPTARARDGIAALLERLHEARRPAYLAVLKRLGRGGSGLLSFPIEGFTLALDLPHTPGIEAVLGGLDEITLRHGGRVYLAKDATLTPEAFAAMYPAADEFRRVKRTVDPEGRLSSSLARRIGLVPCAP